tara:strand:- start:94 stop:246 length:153 start_codon:yes stop_codon:yes gene_type:complete
MTTFELSVLGLLIFIAMSLHKEDEGFFDYMIKGFMIGIFLVAIEWLGGTL